MGTAPNPIARLLVSATAIALCACGSRTGLFGDVPQADAGTIATDAGSFDSASPSSKLPPRPIAPLSTATVTSQRPTLHWALAADTDGAQVEICHDRACAQVVATFTASGTSGAPASALARGVYFWRLRGTAQGAELFVGAWSAPVDSSWGTVPDVDGDGFADVVIGSQPDDGTSALVVNVFRGGANGVAATPATTLGSGFPSQVPSLGAASAGDVNGDGFADVVVTVVENVESGADGTAFVYLGGPSGLSTTPSSTLRAPPSSNGYLLGNSVTSIGDVNGDGYADILVEADWEPGNYLFDAGAAYVFLGSASGLSSSPAATLVAPFPVNAPSAAWSSFASAGDVNGDGFGDVVVGSGANDAPQVSEIDVYLGGPAGLSASPAATIAVPSAPVIFGYLVACAGDVDGDGLADIVVGSDPGQAGDPTLFVYAGTSSAPFLTHATTIVAPAGGVSDFGWAIAGAGDVNGDGFADLVVSSLPDAVDLFFGAPNGVSPTVSLSIPTPSATEIGFAESLAGAGDVNGDGFADVLVGSSGGDAEGGAVLVYLGAPNGMTTTPSTTLDAPAGADGSGFGVILAGVANAPHSPQIVR
jgi:hypothetical protein